NLELDDRQLKGRHPTVVTCRYLIDEIDGRKLLQLNTYGSEQREVPNKLSQTLQFDELAAKQLFNLLKREFSLE
ncbi:MAG: hypothetical protein ABJO30_12815, partial [Hyphomicrobiales bacterium]